MSLHGVAFLAAAALTLVLTLGLGWLTGRWLGPEVGALRLGLGAGAGLLASAAVSLLIARMLRRERLLRRCLDQLRRFDPRQSGASAAADPLPPLETLGDWAPLLSDLREAMTNLARRFQEAEHARTALDIRSRRAATEADQMRGVLATIQEPVFAVNPYNEVTLANPCAEQLLTLTHDTPERRVLSQLIQCDKLLDLVTDIRRRRGTPSRTDEIELAGPDGAARQFRVTATRLAERDEATEEQVVAVLRDVGHEKAEQRRYAEFVSSVSHEMKAPLAGIKAYVEMLADGEAQDETTREEFLDVINTQADRLHRLIDNMLNLARIEAGVTKVSKDHRSLNDLLEEAHGVVQPAAERKQLTLRSELSPMYLSVFVDRDTMLQAAINLLSNAIKYTPDGGRVTLRSRLADQEVEFEVEDNGVGLSPEDRERVFQKFYRVKKNSEMAAGTGLGLSLVKHIVEDVHGGKVSVSSELGRGSVFRVTLPLAQQMA